MEARPKYQVGEFFVDPSRNVVSHNGESTTLEPKAMDVLLVLIDNAGEVVSHEALLESVWKGRVVEEATIYQRVSKIRHALGDIPQNPKYIENVPRRGYRLIAQVRVAAASDDFNATSGKLARTSTVAAGGTRAGRTWPIHRPWLLVALVMCGLAGAMYFSRDSFVTRPSPSIAVLPFENLSPHPEHAYFAAGIYEETLNQLAKIDDLGLIGRTTTARYVSHGKSIPEIGSELNVSAVLEGSVRYADGRVRVTVHLSDASTGKQLWSQAYERDLKDIFAVQFDIAMKVTSALEAEFDLEEQQAIAAIPTTQLNAYSAYVKGLALIRELPPRLPQASHSFQSAIDADPEFADALAAKALVQIVMVGMESAPALSREVERRQIRVARSLAERALRIDPGQEMAHLALSRTAETERRNDEALGHAKAAFENAPNSASAVLGYARSLGERDPDAAISLFDRAIALDPLNPNYPYIACASMVQGNRVKAARQYAQQAMQLAPDSYQPYLASGWVEALAGNSEKSSQLLDRAKDLMTTHITAHERLNLMEANYILGRQDEVDDAFQTIMSLDNLNDGHLFRAYLLHGDVDKALEHLDSMIDNNYPAVVINAVATGWHQRIFDAIRDDPRFRAALSKLDRTDNSDDLSSQW